MNIKNEVTKSDREMLELIPIAAEIVFIEDRKLLEELAKY